MEKPLLDFYLWNHSFVSTQEDESLRSIQDHAVYEVLRLEDGIPLFFEEHYARLISSADLVGHPLPYSEEAVKEQLRQLQLHNGLENGNVKFLWSETATGSHFVLYVSPYRKVSPEDKVKGCKTSLFQLERENPNVKLQQDAYREKTGAALEERGVFELLLYDETGAIREGNRSNFFWIQGDTIFTAPSRSVLMGITRAQVFRAIAKRGFGITEGFLKTDELEAIDAAFLTGTSINVLPIRSIDERTYPSADHPIIHSLAADYLQLIEDDKRKFSWDMVR